MLRLPLLLVLLTHPSRTDYVTESPSFADRLDKLYEKLEKFNIAAAPPTDRPDVHKKLLAKLDRLNSLTPERAEITDADEELLTAMQLWGMLSAEQMDRAVEELQSVAADNNELKSERIVDRDYSDPDWNDEDPDDLDYANDEFYADEEPTGSTIRPGDVTPSAVIKRDPSEVVYRQTYMSAADPIAATNERPRIVMAADKSMLSPSEAMALKKAAVSNILTVMKASKCLTPQPRWLAVRQLAPASDIVYMPPCVQLHRCSPDAGCCHSEAEVCAPVDGKYVTIPFYLNKADGNLTAAKIRFFNHTQCACVSRETLTTSRTRIERRMSHDSQDTHDNTHDSRESHESKEVRKDKSEEKDVPVKNEWQQRTEEPILNADEATAPPQIRRCTCPTLFIARIVDDSCTCSCDWPDVKRRRDCLSLARGKEHFGLRDRVCVANGDCHRPTCEYGAYQKDIGRCPQRRYRRIRTRYQPAKSIVV